MGCPWLLRRVDEYVVDDLRAGPFEVIGQWLLKRGFEHVGTDIDVHAFGNTLVLLQKGPTRIRFVRDRLQWFLQVGAPGGDEWFDIAVWCAAVDGQLPPTAVLSPEEEAVALRERVDAIEGLCSDRSSRTVTLLKEWQSKDAARW